MTLVVNEIYMLEGLKQTVLIAAADRRITKGDRTYHSTQKKLFEIPYLKGAISFFGLAEFSAGCKTHRMSDILPAFITKHADIMDLRTFCFTLRDELAHAIPSYYLKDNPLGFHVCGYGRTSLPDYWWLTNIRQMDGPKITEFKPTFKDPGSHFLGRDAAAKFDWDGSDPRSAKSGVHILYRNGDFLVHALTVDLVNAIFEQLWNLPTFKHPRTPSEYKNLVRYKFKAITGLHKRWLRNPTVDDTADVMMWIANDGKVTKV